MKEEKDKDQAVLFVEDQAETRLTLEKLLRSNHEQFSRTFFLSAHHGSDLLETTAPLDLTDDESRARLQFLLQEKYKNFNYRVHEDGRRVFVYLDSTHQAPPAEELIQGRLTSHEQVWVIRRISRELPLRRAERIFDLVAIAVPRRVRDEEIGDALEDIRRRALTGRPVWQIYAKTASTIIWILINSIRELMSAALGKAKPSRSRD